MEMDEEDVDFVAEEDLLDLMLAKAERLAQQMKASASSSSSSGSQGKGTLPSTIETREDFWTECSSVDLLTAQSSASTTIKPTLDSIYNNGFPQQSMETITIPRDSSSITSSTCSQERIDVAIHTAKLMEIEVQAALMSDGVKELIEEQEKISLPLQNKVLEVLTPTTPPSIQGTPESIVSANLTNVTQKDEDYVPIADYSPPRIIRHSGPFLTGDTNDKHENNNINISTNESMTMMIQWVKVNNAKEGDSDYVQVSDYSPQKLIHESSLMDPHCLFGSGDNIYLQDIAKKSRRRSMRKKRRRRKILIGCLSLVCFSVAAIAYHRFSALFLNESEKKTIPGTLNMETVDPKASYRVSSGQSFHMEQDFVETYSELNVYGKSDSIITTNHTEVVVQRSANIEHELDTSMLLLLPETRFCNHPLYQLFMPLGCSGQELTEIDNEINQHVRLQKLEQLLQYMMQ
jgi:hypothetical protein